MLEITEVVARELRLELVEEGYEPAEGTRVTVLVRGGAGGVIAIDSVSRIVTNSDAWLVYQEEEKRVNCVDGAEVLMVTSEGDGAESKMAGPGFGR